MLLAAESSVSGMTSEAITTALGTVGTLVQKAISMIADNPVLMVCFCAGLVPIGIGIVRSLKRV